MTDTAALHAESGLETPEFASRRTLVLRRFLRSPSAVGSLVVLLALFVGCYALPTFLPYSYTDLDFNALLQPPNARHWLGTNALGQDLLAQTLRGMQKSMLIGVCVAIISTGIAATVGAISGYFGGWTRPGTDVVRRSDAGGAVLSPDHVLTPSQPSSPATSCCWCCCWRASAGWSLADGPRSDPGAEGTRIRPRGKVYGRLEIGRSSPITSCRTCHRSLIIDATINVSTAIITETGLTFFGFGVQPPDVSLGTLLPTAQSAADLSLGVLLPCQLLW